MLNKNGNKVVIKGDVNVSEGGVFSGRDTNIIEIYHVDSKTILMEDIPLNVSGYVYRTEQRRNLFKAIMDTDIIQVYGISGIGKTELVQDISRELKTEYEKSYFISSYENEEVNLAEVISFSGSKINLLDQLNLNKTLVVIDNYNYAIEKLVQEFREANKNGSKLIIVSQAKISSSIEYYRLDFMSFDEAQQLFNGSKIINVNDSEFKEFLQTVDKHPMTLQVLRNYIEDEDNGMEFSDYKDDLFSIVRLEDETKSQSKRICELIVGKYANTFNESFNLIKYVDSNYIEKTFLKTIMKHDIPSLSKRMIVKDRDDHYYIHDIIKESIKAVTESKIGVIPVKDKILSYLSIKIESKLVDYYQFLAFNSGLIIKLLNDVKDRDDKVVIYNLVVTYSNHRNLEEHIKNIEAILDGELYRDYLEVKLYLEMIEIKTQLSTEDEKVELIKKMINHMKELTVELGEDKKVEQLIKHHTGKLYNWIEDYDNAIEIFNDIIGYDGEAYKTILQLCRAHRNLALRAEKEKERDVAKRHISIINGLLASINFVKIPVSIYLEILALVRNRPLNSKEVLETCLWNNFDYFSKIALLYSKNKIFEHIYITIGGLASNISYNQKSFFKEWFEEIEHPVIEYNNDKLITAVINIYVAEIKRRIFSRPKERYDNLVESVMSIWARQKILIKDDEPNGRVEFRYKPIIEIMLKLGEFELAERELNEVFREDNEWHRRYRADILKSKKLYEDAISELNHAIQMLEKKKQNKYLSTFYNDLADVYNCSKNPDCIVALKKAINFCDNPKTTDYWKNKLANWQLIY